MDSSTDRREHLISTAEALFDRHGFTATGMDRLTGAAGMSSRTLYKHIGSKNRLLAAVLEARDCRFLRSLKVDSVDGLFESLDNWFAGEGARGCLFLRSWGETGGDLPEVVEALARHKQRVLRRIGEVVCRELGREDEALTEELMLLYEGATQAIIYRRDLAIPAARRAAQHLVAAARARCPDSEN
ncbi:TetR/AcrR family transcriptional regulator [Salinicola avicenniae]|uniref:TetR/AcrR family transcriptional regulator n=1 Tax=Salinicola avicenniae TaxID=2916836 RepID=UPI00207437AF|nr:MULTISPECIES: TetR/AcrR family transcriptional regulator [unclassified Salinicola]